MEETERYQHKAQRILGKQNRFINGMLTGGWAAGSHIKLENTDLCRRELRILLKVFMYLKKKRRKYQVLSFEMKNNYYTKQFLNWSIQIMIRTRHQMSAVSCVFPNFHTVALEQLISLQFLLQDQIHVKEN